VKRILFVGEGTVSDAVRLQLPAVELTRIGDTEVSYLKLNYRNETPKAEPGADAVVFSRPHYDSLLVSYKRQGIPVIVDMDDDFHSIPPEHPGYNHVGRGDPVYLERLENCLYLADLLIVTTEELKTRLSQFNSNITIIPNGWDSSNWLWRAKRRIVRDRLTIGWGGTITHRQDFEMAVGPLKTIIRKNKNVVLVMAGDYEIYNIFRSVPEDQKMFLPMVSYDTYPYLLSHFDIMLAPLLNNEFNRAKSDIKLVDAGARNIPFIASDMPVYSDWTAGGLLVKDDEWYEALDKYLRWPELRKHDGDAGRKLAAKREFSILGDLWNTAINSAIAAKREEILTPE